MPTYHFQKDFIVYNDAGEIEATHHIDYELLEGQTFDISSFGQVIDLTDNPIFAEVRANPQAYQVIDGKLLKKDEL